MDAAEVLSQEEFNNPRTIILNDQIFVATRVQTDLYNFAPLSCDNRDNSTYTYNITWHSDADASLDGVACGDIDEVTISDFEERMQQLVAGATIDVISPATNWGVPEFVSSV